MKPVTLYLAAALATGFSATPAIAQNAYQEWGNSPLTLEQEQVVSEIRDRDRQLFLRAADAADDIIKRDRRGHWFVKPISDWDQFDFNDFKSAYENLTGGSGNSSSQDFSAIETGLFFRDLTQDGGGDGGGDGAE